MSGLKMSKIINITLSTSMQAVVVEDTVFFSHLVMDTQDGSDFEVAINDEDTETFIYSNERSTAPVVYKKSRRYKSDNTTLFYVKGTVGSIFQAVFFIE